MKSSKNIKRIVERKSFKEFIIAMNYHVDLKEWSEIGGVYEIARRVLASFNPDLIVDAGCGKRPTLATVMALNYKCEIVAVDPQLDSEYSKYINRLTKIKGTLLDYAKETEVRKNILLLANHSHVPKYEVMLMLSKATNWVYITVPCCVDNKLSNETSIHYKDLHMHSEKNDVFIFSKDKTILAKMIKDK